MTEASMMVPWRPLVCAAALNMAVVVGVATAQTVIVTKAPRGAAIELVLNSTTIGTATADNTGKASFPVTLTSRGGRTEADVQVYVDACGNLRRVTLVEPGLQPQLPQIGCTRRELAGVFLLRGITTMVVEATASSPAIWLRQGPVPNEWLGEEATRISSKHLRRPSPTGLVLFGGGGVSSVKYATAQACGDVTSCSGKSSRPAFAAGAAVWIFPFLGAEASYAQSADATASGSESTFRFDHTLSNSMWTVAGKVGLPLGVVRLYVQAGADRHRATSTTTESVDTKTYTDADGVTQTIPGGSQTFVLRTAGWGLSLGGGIEVWAKPKFGLYAEYERAKLLGKSRDGDPGQMDDIVTTFRLGVRVRLFGR
jgi:hypothetical protein